MKISVILFVFSSVLLASSVGQDVEFSKLPTRSQYWVNQSLNRVTGTPQEIVHNAGNRGGCYLAVGLLLRDSGQDRKCALNVINEILKNQYVDPDDMKSFGIWRKNDMPDESIDQNWREFVSTGLIVVLERFGDKVPEVLKRKIQSAILIAAEGAMVRDVGADYTNIAMMSAFLMDYAGNENRRPDLIRKGMDKAKIIYDSYRKYNAVSEFNSPTYAGVDLFAISLWREFGRSENLRKMGQFIERGIWLEIADFYNPSLKNLAGPFFRGYGMDMTRYNAITGLCIALVVQDEELEPLPGKGYPKFSEIDYVNICASVGMNAPEVAIAKLKEINAPRFVSRNVYNRYPGSEIKNVTAYLTPEWMVGAAKGHRRDWNQIVPGAIHWKLSDTQDVGWVLVPAKMKCDVVASDDGLHIRRGGFDGKTLTLLIYSPDVKQGEFTKNSWKQPSISFEIKTSLDAPLLTFLTDKKQLDYTRDETSGVFTVNYEISKDALKNEDLLTIKPVK